MTLRIHWLQHVAFEDLGCIAPWLAARKASVTQTRLYAGEVVPTVDQFDWLIVMGGPMNIYQDAKYPWLTAEKNLIRDAHAAGRKLLGICLGAQLIADALGAPVTRNAQQEIGWFPVRMSPTAKQSKLFAGFPEEFNALHWHGDTFAIPAGATLLASSDACAHQAYECDDRVAAIQFHLEVTAANARLWLEQEPLVPARYVQTAEEIMSNIDRFAENNRLMLQLLENLVAA